MPLPACQTKTRSTPGDVRDRHGIVDHARLARCRRRTHLGGKRRWRSAFFDGHSGRGASRHGGDLTMPQRILIVDDEPNILATVAPLLRSNGYTVLSAMTGGAALEAVD